MLVIRLSRVGKKKQPDFRVIVSEKGKDSGPVEVEERRVVGAVVRTVGDSTAVEIELRYVVILDRTRKECGQVGQPVSRSCQPISGGVDVDLVFPKTDPEFIDCTRVEYFRGANRECSARTSVDDWDEWIVSAEHKRSIK